MQTKAEAAERLKNIAAGLSLIFGNAENVEAVKMGVDALLEPPTTLMGYRIAELQVLAELLREQYVSPITVTKLCRDANYLYQLVSARLVENKRDAQRHIKLGAWEEKTEEEK